MERSRVEAPRHLVLGRESELASLEEWLAKPSGPMVIWGHGGMGKTALAREFARSKPVLFIDVSSATSFDHVVAAIGEQGEFAEAERAGIATLRDALKKRGLSLLVLDNIEQLGEEIRSLERLLDLAPHVLLTSRIRTGLPHEVQMALGPLPVKNDWDSPAIRLLSTRGLARASSVKDEASLDLYRRVAEITDGIPLALDLAASKIATFGAEWTIDRLTRNPLDVRSQLSGRPHRQRTMEESIEWSWELLSDRERLALAGLSLFSGTFGFSEASELFEGVEWYSEEILEALVDQSFLLPVDHAFQLTTNEATPSFRVLVPIREFARRKIEKEGLAVAYRAYARVILDRADVHVERFAGTRRRSSAQALERLRPDLVRVVRPPESLTPEAKDVFRALEALSRLAISGGSMSSYLELVRDESLNALFEKLETDDKRTWLRSRGVVERAAGDVATAKETTLRALDLSPAQDAERSALLIALSRVHSTNQDYEAAYTAALEGMELARELGLRVLECEAALALAFASRYLGYVKEARSVVEGGYSLAKEIDAHWSLERYPPIYAAILFDSGELDAAEQMLRSAIKAARNAPARAAMHSTLSQVLTLGRRYDEAAAASQTAHDIAVAADISLLAANILRERALLELVRSDLAASLHYLDRAVATHPFVSEDPDLHAIRAVATVDSGDIAGAETLATAVYKQSAENSSFALARTILLGYELRRYGFARSEATATVVRNTLQDIFRPNDRGVSWYSQSGDVRIAFSASTSKLESYGFSIPSDAWTNVQLELSADDMNRWAKLGSTVLDNMPLAPFRILKALARREEGGLPMLRAFAAGWPGELANPNASRNRVHVAVSYLRKNLLGELLVRDETGYLLDPRVTIRNED